MSLKTIWLATIATSALVSALGGQAPTGQAERPAMIRLVSEGKPCASAGLRAAEPRSASARVHAQCSLTRKDVRDSSGQIVSGIGLHVWRDGAVTRVRVYTMVPAPGAPNRWLNENDDDEALKHPKHLADYTIELGEEKPIAAMKVLGIEPMVMRFSK